MSKRDYGQNAEESEKAIERYLCKLTKEAGGVALKYASGTSTGYPDRILLLPGGRTIWVEVKSAGKHPTKLQAERILRLRKLGHRVEIIDSRAAASGLFARSAQHSEADSREQLLQERSTR